MLFFQWHVRGWGVCCEYICRTLQLERLKKTNNIVRYQLLEQYSQVLSLCGSAISSVCVCVAVTFSLAGFIVYIF